MFTSDFRIIINAAASETYNMSIDGAVENIL